MGGREDLDHALKAIVAAKRKELGDPPTPEELLAYRDGTLDEVARQSVEARIALDPDAARTLADLAAFPEVEPAPDVPEVTEDEVAAGWLALRRKLDAMPRPGAVSAVVPIRRKVLPPMRLAAAAAVAVALGGIGGYLLGRGTSQPDSGISAINVTLVELAPLDQGEIRSAPAAVEVPGRSEELVLVLAPVDGGDHSDYGVEIRDAAGTSVLERRGLRPTELGTFQLGLRRGALPAGTYRIHLYGQDGDRKSEVAVYELRLLDVSGDGR